MSWSKSAVRRDGSRKPKRAASDNAHSRHARVQGWRRRRPPLRTDGPGVLGLKRRLLAEHRDSRPAPGRVCAWDSERRLASVERLDPSNRNRDRLKHGQRVFVCRKARPQGRVDEHEGGVLSRVPRLSSVTRSTASGRMTAFNRDLQPTAGCSACGSGGRPSSARVSFVLLVAGNASFGTATPSRSQIGSQPSEGVHSSSRPAGTPART
jgi:hypothetical protein